MIGGCNDFELHSTNNHICCFSMKNSDFLKLTTL